MSFLDAGVYEKLRSQVFVLNSECWCSSGREQQSDFLWTCLPDQRDERSPGVLVHRCEEHGDAGGAPSPRHPDIETLALPWDSNFCCCC